MSNEPFTNSTLEIISACFNAIESSIEHYITVKDKMQELENYLQKNNHKQMISEISKDMPPNSEKYYLNEINYIAILTLEKLGINTPTQSQIDIMESAILLVLYRGKQANININTNNNCINLPS